MINLKKTRGLAMNNQKEENEWIKRNCDVTCRFYHKSERWVVKITTTEADLASVEVTAHGFENFRLASDKAIIMFRRNMRDKIKSDTTLKAFVNPEEIQNNKKDVVEDARRQQWWPDLLDTADDFVLDTKEKSNIPLDKTKQNG
jgi:hypothetical protein